jgi:hypothetical protein
VKEAKGVKASQLMEEMNDDTVKIYLLFLKTFLSKINLINLIFQKEIAEIFEAKDELFKVFIDFANHICKPELDPVIAFSLNYDNDFEIESHLLPDEDLPDHFGLLLPHISLQNLPKTAALNVCSTIKKYVRVVLTWMKVYIPFDDIVIKSISTLDPVYSKKADWIQLGKRFPNIIPQDEHFSNFCTEASNWTLDKEKLIEVRPKFLKTIKERSYFDAISFYSDEDLFQKYPFIFKLARALLSLPHSSCSVERCFSQMNLVKNLKRNSLSNDNLESLLMLKINDFDLDQATTVDNLYQFWQSCNSSPLKRKSLSISEESKVLEKQETMNLENTGGSGLEFSATEIDPITKKMKFTSPIENSQNASGKSEEFINLDLS